MTTLAPTDDAVAAWLALGVVLSALPRPTPCQVDPDPFTSDRPAQRREAALACQGCPALAACKRYADAARESWHVWAAVDRTPTASGRKARKETAA